jgi:hypothetical protein
MKRDFFYPRIWLAVRPPKAEVDKRARTETLCPTVVVHF